MVDYTDDDYGQGAIDPKEFTIDLNQGNNFYITVPNGWWAAPNGGSLKITEPLKSEADRAIFFAEANVAIYANGHIQYDTTKTDESARKFWDAVKTYIIGDK